jgi:carbonic anhydrase
MTETGQSPIDLDVSESSIVTDRPAHAYHGLSRGTLTDTGTTISATADPGGILMVHDRPFTLEEIHSHAPSEHTIRGNPSDLEVHFVHQAEDGALAVVGLLFDKHPAAQPIDGLVRPPSTKMETLAEPLTLSNFFPRESRKFLYNGSLTTPPYTEGIQWIVFEKVQWVGADALNAYTERYEPNSRARQRVAGRTVSLI